MTTSAKHAVPTFGKYQILERIATGGMAEIYKARVETIGGFQRIFAIKRILPHLSENQEYISMLVEEAKIAGLLTHANIVQILDLGNEDGIWYIAMEFVEGKDLGAVLKRARERSVIFPVHNSIFIAIELLKGLEYAHQRQMMRGGKAVPLNIIHRDISPPNILISLQGEVKLTDFGIARANHKVMETQSGVIKGRFEYMSPEQAASAKDLDQRSDLFSVGVVLYEMLTGVHPFRTESEFATLDRIRSGKYTPVTARNPDVPPVLEAIVDRALRADKHERFSSATTFKEALDRFFHDSGFLFNQSNLSAYLKLLFPDSKQETRIEAPRRPISEPIYRRPAREPEPAPLRETGRSRLSEEATQTVVNSQQWADEGETVIRSQPPEIRAAVEERPLTLQNPMSHEGRGAWWGPLVGAIGFGVGVVFGAVIGVSMTFGFLKQDTHDLPPSWVQVDAAPEAIVLIDGNKIQGRVSVEPSVSHVLRVELHGKAWQQTFTLVPGEGRMITLVDGKGL